MHTLTYAAAVCAAALSISAQEVVRVDLLRGSSYLQSSEAPPILAPGEPHFFRATATPTLVSLIQGEVTLRTPAGVSRIFSYELEENEYQIEQRGATVAALNSYGAGMYQFMFHGQISGAQNVAMEFTAGGSPAAPRIVNFQAAQQIDASVDFELSWQTPAATVEAVTVRITDSDGEEIISSAPYIQPDAITGEESAWIIPAEVLEPGRTYTATVAFYDITDLHELSLPFWSTSWTAETSFSLVTTGGAQTDPTAPVLQAVSPENGAVLSEANGLNFPVVFQFDDPMAASASIRWSANIAAENVTYLWSPDRRSLVCSNVIGWPAAAKVEWVLNPVPGAGDNFRNEAGLELLANASSGSFTTGPVVQTPCGEENWSFFIGKALSYRQAADGEIALDLAQPATFAAYMRRMPGDASLHTIQMTANGPTEPLETIPGLFLGRFVDHHQTLSELDSAYPAGAYILNRGATSISVQVEENAYPEIPRFTNLPVQDAGMLENGFTLRWSPPAGADEISIVITREDGFLVFRAPDECLGRTLGPEAESVVIPAGTLQAGAEYSARLTFLKNVDEKAFPGLPGMGRTVMQRSTTALLTRSPGEELPPNYNKFATARLVNGGLRFEFIGAPGRVYNLEAAADLNPPVHWAHLQASEAGANAITWLNPDDRDFMHRYFRVREAGTTLPLQSKTGGITMDAERRVSVSGLDAFPVRITGKNGERYSLSLSEDSLLFREDLEISAVTKVEGLPFAAGFAAAVSIAPHGTEFETPGTLSVQLPFDPPAALVAFGYNPGGAEFFLIPHTRSGLDVIVSVEHGGVVGLAVASPQEILALSVKEPRAFADRLAHLAAVEAFPSGPAGEPAGLKRQAALDLKLLFQTHVRPALLQAMTFHDPRAGLSLYRQWFTAAVQAGQAATLISEIQDGNNLAVALIETETTYLEPKVRAHNHDAILKLQLLRSYIAKDPWQNGFAPGQKQALYDRIRNLLRAELEFETTLRSEFEVGVTQVALRSRTEFYFPGDPRDAGKMRGESPLSFVERTHFPMPAPCSVQTGAPGSGKMLVANIWFHGSGLGSGTGTNRQWRIADISVAAFPEPILEGFQVVCPTYSESPTYWWGQFANFHSTELRKHKLADGLERLTFDFEKGWNVRASGNALLATRRHNRNMNIEGADLHELTVLRVIHAPR